VEETVNQPAEGTGEQYDRVLITITDFQRQFIRLTARQWHHAVGHGPYMLGMQGAVRHTLESPDEVRESRDDPRTVKLYYKWYSDTPVGRKLMCVVVK
jgi:hypothetical protein